MVSRSVFATLVLLVFAASVAPTASAQSDAELDAFLDDVIERGGRWELIAGGFLVLYAPKGESYDPGPALQDTFELWQAANPEGPVG